MDAGPAGWGRPLYERVLDAVGAVAGSALLDVGCGSGQLCRLAADRGVQVTGVDADPERLAQAATLVPEAALHRADLHALPFDDDTAAAASCVQVLMHLVNPLAALRELARVAAPGALVAATVWGPPERCAVGAFGRALAPLLGPARPGSRVGPPGRPGSRVGSLAESGSRGGSPAPSASPVTPPSLSVEGRLARLAELAGLHVLATEEVTCVFDYPNEQALLAGLYASELGRRALAVAGRAPVRRAVLAGLAGYREPGGGYRLDNTFRLLLSRA